MAEIGLEIRITDNTLNGFNVLKRRIEESQNQITQFNRSRSQQERAHTQFLSTQYRERVRERQRALQDEMRAAERARRDEVRAAERAQRDEERLRRYHQQLVIRSRRDEARAAEASARRQEQAIRRVARTYDRIFSRIARIGTRLAGATILGSILGTGSVLRTGIQFDNIRRGLEAVSGSAEEANRQVEQLRNLAQLPGIQFQQAVTATLQLQGTGVAAQRATELIQVFGNELAIVGGTDLEGTIRALTQIASRGQVAQEEINQLAERLPTINQLLRDAFGVTTAEGIRGVIGNDINLFFDRLVTAGRGRPQADANSITNVISNFRNAVAELSDELAQLALPRLTEQIERATNIISQNSNRIIDAFETISDIALNVVDDIISGIDTLIVRFESFIGIIRGALLAGVTLGFTRFFGNATLALTSFSSGLTNATSGAGLLATRLGGTRALAGLTRFSSGLGKVTAGLTGLTAALGVGAAIFAGVELFRLLSSDADFLRTNVDRLNTSLVDTRERLTSIQGVQQEISFLNRQQVGERLSNVTGEISAAADDIAESLGFFTQSQAQSIIADLTSQGLSGRTGLARRRRIAEIRELTRSERELRDLANERLEQLRRERSEESRGGHTAAARRRELTAQNNVLSEQVNLLEESIRLRRQLQTQFNLSRGGNVSQQRSALTPSAGAARSAIQPLDIQDPVGIATLRVGLRNFHEDLRSTRAIIRTNVSQPFLSVFSALADVTAPQNIRQPIDFDAVQRGIQSLPSPLLVNESVERTAIQNVFQYFADQTERIRPSLDSLLAPDRVIGRGRGVDRALITGELGEAVDNLSSLRVQLRRRYDEIIADQEAFRNRVRNITSGLADALGGAALDIVSIPSQLVDIRRETASQIESIERNLAAEIERINNSTELNQRQRARRIEDAERDAAAERIEIAQQAEAARSEAYLGWARTALRSIAQVIAAEAQTAIARSFVQAATPFVTSALAGVGTAGTLGLGLGAFAGLQLLASSFHNPVLDDAARYAGLNNAQQLQSNPRAFGEQSGRDLVSNYDAGFQSGLQNNQGGGGSGEPIVIQIENVTNLDGSKVAENVTRHQLRMSRRGIIPEIFVDEQNSRAVSEINRIVDRRR